VVLVLTGYLAVAGFVLVSPGRREPSQLADAETRRGLDLWRRENCASCHAQYGLGGHLGPDIVNVMRNRGEEYARLIIQTGHIGMPAFELSDGELNDLMAYLRFLDGTGRYPDRDRPLSIFGRAS